MAVANSFSVIIMAAGKGTRMATSLPKVLHPVAGQPMITRLIKACQNAGAQEIRVVLGHKAEVVSQIVTPLGAICHIQVEQNGTADAVQAAQPETLKGLVMVLNGDHPLISSADIQQFVAAFYEGQASLCVVTTTLDSPGNFGRILRENGRLSGIVEFKDASESQRQLREVNTGIYLARAEDLTQWLREIQPSSVTGELYLPDVVTIALKSGRQVQAIDGRKDVALGVNSQLELAKANQIVFGQMALRAMENGVTVLSPLDTYIEESVAIGSGSVIYPGVHLKGATRVGHNVVIEPHSMIFDSQIGDSCHIKMSSYIVQSRVGAQSQIGPFAHLRPESRVGERCRIGNFVEMKKTDFGDGSKAGHLTYLGDAVIGKDVNIGCGTITANFNVKHEKHKTIIGDRVFVGSDSQLVAPLTVGDNAVIGCGSTITKDVPSSALAVARAKQITKLDYVKAADDFANSDKE